MKIETRKSIGELIFFLKDNKIKSSEIQEVNTTSKLDTPPNEVFNVITSVTFTVRIANRNSTLGYNYAFVDDKDAFDTEEELIKSLY